VPILLLDRIWPRLTYLCRFLCSTADPPHPSPITGVRISRFCRKVCAVQNVGCENWIAARGRNLGWARLGHKNKLCTPYALHLWYMTTDIQDSGSKTCYTHAPSCSNFRALYNNKKMGRTMSVSPSMRPDCSTVCHWSAILGRSPNLRTHSLGQHSLLLLFFITLKPRVE